MYCVTMNQGPRAWSCTLFIPIRAIRYQSRTRNLVCRGLIYLPSRCQYCQGTIDHSFPHPCVTITPISLSLLLFLSYQTLYIKCEELGKEAKEIPSLLAKFKVLQELHLNSARNVDEAFIDTLLKEAPHLTNTLQGKLFSCVSLESSAL